MPFISFKGKQSIKDKFVQRAAHHKQCDEITKGVYFQKSGNKIKACCVGCLIHSSDHSKFESEMGIPEGMAHLVDYIFEGLPENEFRDFPSKFIEAVPVGVDLEPLAFQFHLYILTDKTHGAIRYANPEGKEAILQVAKLIKRRIKGLPVPQEEWSAARSAAESSAESAAWSAAWSAARSAARSAAESSAESAAWSAAWSAARSAARSAAWSAAWSAARSAAESAAESAAASAQAKYLLKLLKKVK